MKGRSGAVWVPAWVLAAVGAAVGLRLDGSPLDWWFPLGLAGFGVIVAVIVAMATDKPWAMLHRCCAVLAGGAWAAVVARNGWSPLWVLGLLGGALVVAALEFAVARDRVVVEWARDAPDVDRRPRPVQEWEAMLRRLTKSRKKRGEEDEGWEWANLRVLDVTPWPDPTAGEQVHLALPEGMTVKDLAGQTDKIAAARRLPQGCVVRVLDAEHQGAAILDVMSRDCLAADGKVHVEPAAPVSVNDPFEIARTARGESLTVSLRSDAMVVGGTTESGKTTLLHRIIMRMACAVDALIWIVDPNGGGLAAPWIGPWARGEANEPTVDWVADDPLEAAVLTTIASAIVKDRKTNRQAYQRRKAANTTVLPVGPDLPLVLVITDEGGELRQMAGLLATLADEGLARLAQIGRAEGGRVVQSVLRGTSDLLGKGLRAVAAIRVCLRMDEDDEYTHILGVNPGKARLLHMGSAYVYRTKVDHRPILARTVNVDLDSIERHAITTAHLRPKLDERGRQVAAKVTARDVLGGRDPLDHPELRRLPVFADLEKGLAYENRWKRKAAMLAELRGEDVPEVEQPAERPVVERPTVAAVGSAAERFLLGTGVTVERQAARSAVAVMEPTSAEPDGAPASDESDPAAPVTAGTAREAIVLVLRDAYPDVMTAAQVHAEVVARGVEVSYTRVHDLLKSLAGKGDVRQVGTGYTLILG